MKEDGNECKHIIKKENSAEKSVNFPFFCRVQLIFFASCRCGEYITLTFKRSCKAQHNIIYVNNYDQNKFWHIMFKFFELFLLFFCVVMCIYLHNNTSLFIRYDSDLHKFIFLLKENVQNYLKNKVTFKLYLIFLYFVVQNLKKI